MDLEDVLSIIILSHRNLRNEAPVKYAGLIFYKEFNRAGSDGRNQKDVNISNVIDEFDRTLMKK